MRILSRARWSPRASRSQRTSPISHALRMSQQASMGHTILRIILWWYWWVLMLSRRQNHQYHPLLRRHHSPQSLNLLKIKNHSSVRTISRWLCVKRMLLSKGLSARLVATALRPKQSSRQFSHIPWMKTTTSPQPPCWMNLSIRNNHRSRLSKSSRSPWTRTRAA